MSFERRLHPASFVFNIAGQLKELLLPGFVVIFTAGSTGGRWETWLMFLVIPYSLVALGRMLSYRYRLDESEMVVRTGFVFRNERRIPYARIQSIDAVQHLLHRLMRVVEVRIQTGAGAEPEATMRVLPLDAVQEMRERVAAQKKTAPADVGPVAPATTRHPVLVLPIRELLLAGFIDNRGVVLIATVFGVLWEIGQLNRVMDALLDDSSAGRSAVRVFGRAVVGRGMPSLRYVVLTFAAFAALLLFIRLLSMVQSVVKLHGFTLSRDGDELHVEYGLVTRVTTTIPLRRIQLLTVSETPLHRLCGRVAVRADTAGGTAPGQGTVQREALAPIVRRDELARVLGEVMPGVPLAHVAWQPVARGAARREFTQGAALAVLISLFCVVMLRGWTLVLLAVLLAGAALLAPRTAAALGWATLEEAVLFKSGWLWRHTSVTRFSRMQAVRLAQSPFDRRTRMARVAVDTAGASLASHAIRVPYLPIDTARDLHRTLTAHAARTTFRW
jgi:putative membrane protein